MVRGTWNPVRFLPIEMDKEPWKSYAYAFLMNPLKTNVFVLDIDSKEKEHRDMLVDALSRVPLVRDIDVLGTSFDKDSDSPIRFHIWVGLQEFQNVLEVYKVNIDGVCKGFMNGVLQRLEIVSRISRKFNVETKYSTNPKWLCGYSREKDNEWQSFTSEQLIAPLTTVDGVSLSETHLTSRPRLKLRG